MNAQHSTADVFEVVLGTCMFLWDGSAPDTSPDRALPRIPLGLSIFFAGSSAPPNPCQGSVPDPVLFEYCKKKVFFWLQPYKLTHNWRKFKLFTSIDSRVTEGNGIKSFLAFGPPSHTLCKCERKT